MERRLVLRGEVSSTAVVKILCWSSISNRSGKPASGPGLDLKYESVWFLTRWKTRPADSWRVIPGPVPVNLRVSPGLAKPVRFHVLGFTFMVTFGYVTVDRKILTSVRHSPFSMYWPPQWLKQIDTRPLPHPQNECQQSGNDFGVCIFGNMSGA